jgi:hypothetical protein
MRWLGGLWLVAWCSVLAVSPAQAACGSAFCAVNTDWSTQGEWTRRGGRVDLRFEFIDQDQPKAGAEKVAVGQVPMHHDEVRTINRNWILSFDYNFDARWGVSAWLPWVSRSHEHIHNHHGEQIPESWTFSDPGDARVTGRYRFGIWDGGTKSAGVIFGLKLPTGPFDVTNDEGEEAERSVQPGTGTTDGIIALFYNQSSLNRGDWFTQVRFDSAFDSRDGYRPGDRFYFDLGYRYPLGSRWVAMVQLNAQLKEHDSGENAEPDDSGGVYVFVTPGVSFAISPSVQVYTFVQLPLYQYVNGVQLTADWAAIAGISVRF